MVNHSVDVQRPPHSFLGTNSSPSLWILDDQEKEHKGGIHPPHRTHMPVMRTTTETSRYRGKNTKGTNTQSSLMTLFFFFCSLNSLRDSLKRLHTYVCTLFRRHNRNVCNVYILPHLTLCAWKRNSGNAALVSHFFCDLTFLPRFDSINILFLSFFSTYILFRFTIAEDVQLTWQFIPTLFIFWFIYLLCVSIKKQLMGGRWKLKKKWNFCSSK